VKRERGVPWILDSLLRTWKRVSYLVFQRVKTKPNSLNLKKLLTHSIQRIVIQDKLEYYFSGGMPIIVIFFIIAIIYPRFLA